MGNATRTVNLMYQALLVMMRYIAEDENADDEVRNVARVQYLQMTTAARAEFGDPEAN